MTLDLYVARRFLFAFLGVLGAFFLLLALIDFVEGMRRFGGEAEMGAVLALTLLSVPQGLYAILPLVAMIAAIALFLALARSSELAVTRAAGRSMLRALLGPGAVALAVGALAVAGLNPLVAATAREYGSRVDRLSGSGAALALAEDGLWLRQGGAGGPVVIHAARSNAEGTALSRVTFLSFDDAGRPMARVEAQSARLEDGAWALSGAKAWPLGADNPEAAATLEDGLRVPTTLTAASIRDSFGEPAEIGVWDLPRFIARLEEAGFTATRHRVHLQAELALPLFLLSTVLIAACFTLQPQRGRRVGLLALLAVLAGFGAYALRSLATVLGDSGAIPPALAAWAPPAVAGALALGVLLHLEEG